VISGQGTAVAFVVVASCFLSVTMLGWRLVGVASRWRRVSLGSGRAAIAASRQIGKP